MFLSNPNKRRDLVYQALSPTHSRRIKRQFHIRENIDIYDGFKNDDAPKSRLERTVLLLEGRDPRRAKSTFTLAIDKKGWRENELVEKRRLRKSRRRETENKIDNDNNSVTTTLPELNEPDETSEEEEPSSYEPHFMLDEEKRRLLKQMLQESFPKKKSSRASVLLRKECFFTTARAKFNRHASLNALCPVEPCEKTLQDLPDMFRYKPIGNRPSQKLHVVAPRNVLGHDRTNSKHVVCIPSPQPEVYRSWKYPLPLSKTMKFRNKEKHTILEEEKRRKMGNEQRRNIRERIVANNRGIEKQKQLRSFKHLASVATSLRKLKRFKSRSMLNRRMSTYASSFSNKLNKIESDIAAAAAAENAAKRKRKMGRTKNRKSNRKHKIRSGRRSGRATSGVVVLKKNGLKVDQKRKSRKKKNATKTKTEEQKKIQDDDVDGIVFHSLSKIMYSNQHLSDIMGGLSIYNHRTS